MKKKFAKAKDFICSKIKKIATLAGKNGLCQKKSGLPEESEQAVQAEQVEPFPGAKDLCAIGVSCFKNADAAAKEAQIIFGKNFSADWDEFCLQAGDPLSVNIDLLIEGLASRWLSCMNENPFEIPLPLILKYLYMCEFGWKEEKQGIRPSAYLQQLLGYTLKSADLNQAYKTLGLSRKAGLDEVKKVHREYAKKFHPDAINSLSSEEEKIKARVEFEKIQKAYEEIISSEEHS